MSDASTSPVDRTAVRERLDRVHDPELDRSIVDLQYVDSIRIDGSRVAVTFVLPTAWCSPAFAWMMATGIRDEVGSLPGVDEVDVELRDHMHGEQINRGVDQDLAFEAVFDDAEDGIDAVRRKLDHKARLVRQHEAVETLLDAGLDPEQIVDLTLDDLEHLADRVALSPAGQSFFVTVPAEPIRAYVEKAREVGLFTTSDDRLFVDPDGEPIAPDEFESVRLETRLARSNVSGQAGICAQLHEARNDVDVRGD